MTLYINIVVDRPTSLISFFPTFYGDLIAQIAEWIEHFASGVADSSLIPSRVKPTTLKLLCAAPCLTLSI